MESVSNDRDVIHGHAKAHFTLHMEQHCKHVWPKNSKYDSYKDELDSLEPNSALDKLIETCTHLRTMCRSKRIGVDTLDSSLYINNVIENHNVKTLVGTFGLFNDRLQIITALESAMHKGKHTEMYFPNSLLSDSIHSLGAPIVILCRW